MDISEFDFELPKDLIAYFPAKERDCSQLLLGDSCAVIKFSEIKKIFIPGDVLVLNDSRVIRAKLSLSNMAVSGGKIQGDRQQDVKIQDTKIQNVCGKNIQLYDKIAHISINLNRPISDIHISEDNFAPGDLECGDLRSYITQSSIWSGFVKPAKKVNVMDEFYFGSQKLVVINKFQSGEVHVKFVLDGMDVFTFLEKYGQVPLPPYIKRDVIHAIDNDRYQNVYAQNDGSVAAPTAGLHFTNELLDDLREYGVSVNFLTLHVGAGTFMPVKSQNVDDHTMHSEFFSLSDSVAKEINRAKDDGRRVIAVGTSVVRALEGSVRDQRVCATTRSTQIFIKPGYNFIIPDAIITNFHLPKSTLFMLVCAFVGVEKAKQLYRYAIDNRMRFFSYGDAMFIKKINL